MNGDKIFFLSKARHQFNQVIYVWSWKIIISPEPGMIVILFEARVGGDMGMMERIF